ncbi:MAG: GNAT family N-acetyltransferase [Anaeroplasma sp.]|nr:GNAT family N-acetyltransferase [Anaeroplasma sp.]
MNIKVDITNIILKTERLVLRPWKNEDLDDLYEYASVDGVGQMAGWTPHKNKEESLNILNMFITEKRCFALEYNNKVIGSLGIEMYDENQFSEFESKAGCEIGYVLSKDYWGKGLMTEAVKRVIKYLFDDLSVDIIFCGHFVDNYRSKRVQEKNGFKHYKKIEYKTRYDVIKESWVSILERNDYMNNII